MTWVLVLWIFTADPRGEDFDQHRMVEVASFQTFEQCMAENTRIGRLFDEAWAEERAISLAEVGYPAYPMPWRWDGDNWCRAQRGAQS